MFQVQWLRNLVDMAHTRKERRRRAVRNRRLPQRPRLFLEPLEDRTLLSAWAPIGPAPILNGQTAGNLPVSGRVTGIAADPGNANIVYVATAGGGIWEYDARATTNPANNAWTPLTDNPTDSSGKPLTDSNGNPAPEFMGAVAVTDATAGPYSRNQIVYAGTGEANNSTDSFYGVGILVSVVGGRTWTLTTAGGAFQRETISKIAIDPFDPTGGTAYAAVSGRGTNGFTGNTGIWKTTDFGQTWTNMTGAAGLSKFDSWSDVVIDPIQQGGKTVLYAAEGDPSGTVGNGVYKSVNGGTTWNLLNGQGAVNGSEDGRISLALFDGSYQGKNVNELFVAISQKSGNGSGLYEMLKSTNGGDTFSDLTNKTGLTNYLGKQGWYDTTLAISPQNPNYIYAGGAFNSFGPTFSGSPLESFDGGDNWTDIATIKGVGPHSDDHAVAFDKNGDLLDGNDGGVFKLTNPTDKVKQSWESLNSGLQTIQFVSIAAAVDPTTNNLIVYGGSQDNGTEKYTGALGWTLLLGGDGGITQVDPNQPNIVYAEYQNLGLNVSNNGGKNFNDITKDIQGSAPKFYAPYVRDASGFIYYSTNTLNFSKDQGGKWYQIGTPGSNNFNPGGPQIHAIAVSPTDNRVVYVSAGNGMFVTRNAQAVDAFGNVDPASVTWTQINLPNRSVAFALNSIVIDPSVANGGTAYAVVNSFSTGGGKHVYKTTNFGSTWTDISGNLPNTPVWSVLVSPDGKTVYVGTDMGVYSTSNGGTNWARFGTGLPNAQVTQLVYVASKNILVAGTYGRGAWATALTDTPVVITNPTNATVTAGQGISFTAQPAFTARALGTPLPSVVWQVSTDGGKTWKGFPAGAALPPVYYSTDLTFNPVYPWLNGYQYRAVFTNLKDGVVVGSATTSAATLTVLPANAATRAANVSDVFSSNTQSVNLSATVDDASIPTDTVDEGTVTFTVENGSTLLGSVQGTVSGGTANANFTLPAGLPIGNYTIAVSYSDGSGTFTDAGDTNATLTVAPAATTTQLVQASLTTNLSNMTALETLTAHVSSSAPVLGGIVTFAVADQMLSANVDGNGNATITLTVPLLNLLAPQVIKLSYADPAQDWMASASTQTQLWQPLNLLLPSVAMFGPNGETVTMDLFGLLLTFTDGLLREMDFGLIHLVF